MPTAVGPNTKGEENLVFGYDLGDVSNSYKGEPAVNLLSNVDDWSSGWTGNLFGNWVNATVTANAGVAPDGTTTASKLTGGYSRWQRINCSTSTTYTFSFWIKNIDLPIAPQIHIAFGLNGSLVNYNNVTTIALDTIGEWTRVSKTHTSPSSGINQMEVGVTWSSNYPNTNSVLVWHAMCEQNAHLTPFTAGTRSATEGLKDLTGNSTIDLTNVSFDSDAQMTFDGTSDYISLPSALTSSFNPTQFTVEAVVNSDSFGVVNSSRPYISNWNTWSPGSQKGFILRTYGVSQNTSFWWCDGTNYTSISATTQMSTGQYYHILATYSPSVVTLYVNGVAEATSANLLTGVVFESTTRIGHGTINQGWFDGEIPVAKVYNRALTASEIKSNFNAIKGRFNI